jgi:tetratricopeptide (TPR) repeat protein
LKRLLVARAFLALFAAAAALGGVEGTLRARWGAPPREETWAEFDDNYAHIEDHFFRLTLNRSWRPVYASSRRRAVPQEFPAWKKSGTFRVFVVGGSVAMAFGYDDPTRLRELFQKSLPGRSIEVIGCGMGGFDSYRDALIEREALEHEPDAIVVLSGNNEFFQPETASAWAYHLRNRLRRLWLFRWPQDSLVPTTPPVEPTLKERLAFFEENLNRMARRAREKHVPVIFCTLPVDIRDLPPLRSRPRWDSAGYSDAWSALDAGEDGRAKLKFERYVQEHPEDPFGHYWLAKLLDRKGLFAAAREHYLRALDLDDPGERCSRERNQAIRRAARDNGMITADLEKEFDLVADEHLPDARIFSDQVHWYREYYPLVSAVILRSIQAGVRSGNPLLPPAAAWDWRALDALGPEILRPSISPERRDGYGDESVYRAMTVAMQAKDAIDESAVSFFEREAARDPARLEFLAASPANLRPGLEAYPWFQPHGPRIAGNWDLIRVHVGETFRRRKDYAKALPYFDDVLRRRPGLELARVLRAKTAASLGRKRGAE